MKTWRPIINHGPYEVQHLDGAGEGDDFCYRIVPALPGDEGEASTGYETATAAVNAINERGILIF